MTTQSAEISLKELRRSQREIRAGDTVFRGCDPRRVYFVAGELPDDDLEVVSAAQIKERTIRAEGLGDVLDAIRSGRLVTYRLGADEVTGYPSALGGPDPDEVRR